MLRVLKGGVAFLRPLIVKYFRMQKCFKTNFNVQGKRMKKKCGKPEIFYMNPESAIKYQANSNYILREIAGEFILVPTGKALENFNGLVTINETGALLWRFLEEAKTLEEIIDSFAKEFELTREESLNDVCDFLDPAVTRHVILKCG